MSKQTEHPQEQPNTRDSSPEAQKEAHDKTHNATPDSAAPTEDSSRVTHSADATQESTDTSGDRSDATGESADTTGESTDAGEASAPFLSRAQFQRILRYFLPSDPLGSLEQELGRLRKELPTPCIQLLGEPQVGKSSVVRALTKDPNARIGLGDGVPVTESIHAYRFPPEAELPLWTFLDTPGLGADEWQPEEAMFGQLIKGEATDVRGQALPAPHMLLVCLRADDETLHILPWAQKAAEALVQGGEPLPVLVVQTCLHRLLHPHPVPYPFGKDGGSLPENLPKEPRDRLLRQRQRVLALLPQSHFVVVDLTDEEDEVGDPLYGASALLSKTYSLLPQAIARLLRTSQTHFDDAYTSVATPMIWGYAVAAAPAGALPPPFGDIATVAIALTLLRQLATLYRQPWELRTVLDLLWSLGSTTLLWFLLRYLARRLPIPVLMAPLGAVGAFTLVFSLGHLMDWYYSQIRQGHQPTQDEIRDCWGGLQTEAQKRAKSVIQGLWDDKEEEQQKNPYGEERIVDAELRTPGESSC